MEQGSDKRREILEAATALLCEDGLHELSFKAIAARAGLSRQLVRYYYSDLDSLMNDLCDHFGAAYRDILVAGIVDLGQIERLDFFIDFFFGVSSTHPMPTDNLEAYDALVAYAVTSEPFRGKLCDQYRTLGHVMTHELAIAYPELSSHACEELSYLFVSMMHTHWSFVASLGHNAEHGHLTRDGFKRVLESYLNNPAAAPVIDRPWERSA